MPRKPGPIGFQKNSVLYIARLILEEAGKPMTYEELYAHALRKGYRNKAIMEGPVCFGQRVREDNRRRKEKSVFQLVDYKTVGLRKWGYPEFNREKYWENIHREREESKRVTLMKAIIDTLEEEGKPMRVRDIFQKAIIRAKVISKSKTPFKSVNSNITHEINNKGEESRFVRLSKGVIGLRKWYSEE